MTGLVCQNCLFHKRKSGKKPLCETLRGCPVSDCAPDPVIESAYRAFIRAKEFGALSYASNIQEQILEEAGFLDDPDTLYECEMIFAKYQEKEAKKR